MKNAIIIHGRAGKEEYFSDKYPASSNSNWIPWLQKQLLIRGIYTQAPEMPLSYAPDFHAWKKEFERYDITPGVTLVGYSNGAAFLVRWLSENRETRVGKVVLVAPTFETNEHMKEDTFKFEIDSNLASRADGITILIGLKDEESVHMTTKSIKSKIDSVKIVEFPDRAHFNYEDIGTEFPELLKEII